MPETVDPIQPIEKLTNVVRANDGETVRALILELVAHVYSNSEIYDTEKAAEILNILRRRRLFEEMRQAADAFLANDCSTFMIRKYYAQALLDLGYSAVAEYVLNRLKNDAEHLYQDSSKEPYEREEAEEQWAEACGLLGRALKDRFVNANAPEMERNQATLNRAITYYYDCYTANEQLRKKRHWHGINAVALARLAERQEVPITKQFDVPGTAKTIIDEVADSLLKKDDTFDIWAAATAMEASIALENWEGSYSWAKMYVDPQAPGGDWVDAFEIAGTLRQLEQVWKLNVREEPGSVLIPLLRARLQDLEGFNFNIPISEQIDAEFLAKQADALEKRFGGNFLSFRVYRNGLTRAKAVARIGADPEEHLGTGFLIAGEDLHATLADRRFLVTCDHVVSAEYSGALRPNRAIVTFRADAYSVQWFKVQSIFWSRPVADLDVCLLTLEGDLSKLPLIPLANNPPDATEERVLIFGHAEGGELSFSLGDNRLIDQNNRYLQYRAPTVGGSSGSPVFNTDWELVAVHNRGGYRLKKLTGHGTHEANQGSSVLAIRQELLKELGLS